MSISHRELFRLLPLALKNINYNVADNYQITAKYADGKLIIIPGIEHTRKIASLELPVLHILFEFTDISSLDVTKFLSKFNRTYQRGGG